MTHLGRSCPKMRSTSDQKLFDSLGIAAGVHDRPGTRAYWHKPYPVHIGLGTNAMRQHQGTITGFKMEKVAPGNRKDGVSSTHARPFLQHEARLTLR
jgi:hypothetical protein